VDAGQDTINISAYRRTSLDAQSYTEIAPSRCKLHLQFVFSCKVTDDIAVGASKGSVFVTRNAEANFECKNFKCILKSEAYMQCDRIAQRNPIRG